MDNHEKRERHNRWMNQIYGDGQPHKHWRNLRELRDAVHPDGSCMIGHMIPAGQVITPMQADEFLVFVEELDGGFLGDRQMWDKYGQYQGEVVLVRAKEEGIRVIGEVYGKAFVIPIRSWKRGGFAAERDGANECR